MGASTTAAVATRPAQTGPDGTGGRDDGPDPGDGEAAPGRTAGPPSRPRPPWLRTLLRGSACAGFALALTVLFLALPGPSAGLPPEGRTALVIAAAALGAWALTRIDEVFVALTAALALVLTGVVDGAELLGALGDDTIWLLIAACVLAAGITASGLTARLAVALVVRARTVRQLAHLCTLALLVTALAVPSTSGRAALALPVFVALAHVLADRPAVVRALALLFPTVVLLSAVATLIGAGAHLITSELLAAMTGTGIGFGWWLLLGLPLAAVSSHTATELVLLTMTRRADRRTPLHLEPARIARQAGTRIGVPLNPRQRRTLAIVLAVIALWCTGTWHGLSPTLVALCGAVAVTAPALGSAGMNRSLAEVPWPLLMFMAATMVLGSALASSGAAAWLAGAAFGGFAPGPGAAGAFLAAVVAVSAGAHLVLPSRSARSAVLVPVVIPLAAAFGLNPAAVAFASTAAAGFCHTLPSSAKPVALFSDVPGVPTYRRGDLLRLALPLGPVTAGLVLGFTYAVWPLLGLPLR
ncbi:SLC13 family permease [Allonocardiopsis opalescens]|uniref:Anion transporter n=1 Tax=Allonocardiopsis opalescens TaxID=1144618 RepID=A0A2T0PS69_9ACTN|nr:SLC13 family permease [Allonocardiopsis opalescens]PRX91749.1 anion transporter [Allonocardiopsis opalescens]